MKQNSALIVIDIQKQFVDDLPEEMKGEQVVHNAIRVIEYFREKKVPVIFFREVHRKAMVDFGRELDGTESIHCIEDTEAAWYYDGIEPAANDFQMIKRRYSCFYGTDLEILLKGLNVNTLYVIGLLTDVCVHYTCADAHQGDYHVKVIREAVGGSSLKAHEAALEAVEYLQKGSVISIQELI